MNLLVKTLLFAQAYSLFYSGTLLPNVHSLKTQETTKKSLCVVCLEDFDPSLWIERFNTRHYVCNATLNAASLHAESCCHVCTEEILASGNSKCASCRHQLLPDKDIDVGSIFVAMGGGVRKDPRLHFSTNAYINEIIAAFALDDRSQYGFRKLPPSSLQDIIDQTLYFSPEERAEIRDKVVSLLRGGVYLQVQSATNATHSHLTIIQRLDKMNFIPQVRVDSFSINKVNKIYHASSEIAHDVKAYPKELIWPFNDDDIQFQALLPQYEKKQITVATPTAPMDLTSSENVFSSSPALTTLLQDMVNEGEDLDKFYAQYLAYRHSYRYSISSDTFKLSKGSIRVIVQGNRRWLILARSFFVHSTDELQVVAFAIEVDGFVQQVYEKKVVVQYAPKVLPWPFTADHQVKASFTFNPSVASPEVQSVYRHQTPLTIYPCLSSHLERFVRQKELWGPSKHREFNAFDEFSTPLHLRDVEEYSQYVRQLMAGGIALKTFTIDHIVQRYLIVKETLSGVQLHDTTFNLIYAFHPEGLSALVHANTTMPEGDLPDLWPFIQQDNAYHSIDEVGINRDMVITEEEMHFYRKNHLAAVVRTSFSDVDEINLLLDNYINKARDHPLLAISISRRRFERRSSFKATEIRRILRGNHIEFYNITTEEGIPARYLALSRGFEQEELDGYTLYENLLYAISPFGNTHIIYNKTSLFVDYPESETFPYPYHLNGKLKAEWKNNPMKGIYRTPECQAYEFVQAPEVQEHLPLVQEASRLEFSPNPEISQQIANFIRGLHYRVNPTFVYKKMRLEGIDSQDDDFLRLLHGEIGLFYRLSPDMTVPERYLKLTRRVNLLAVPAQHLTIVFAITAEGVCTIVDIVKEFLHNLEMFETPWTSFSSGKLTQSWMKSNKAQAIRSTSASLNFVASEGIALSSHPRVRKFLLERLLSIPVRNGKTELNVEGLESDGSVGVKEVKRGKIDFYQHNVENLETEKYLVERYFVISRQQNEGSNLTTIETNVIALSYTGQTAMLSSFEGLFIYVPPKLTFPFLRNGDLDIDNWSPKPKVYSKAIAQGYDYFQGFKFDSNDKIHQRIQDFVHHPRLSDEIFHYHGFEQLLHIAQQDNDMNLHQDVQRHIQVSRSRRRYPSQYQNIEVKFSGKYSQQQYLLKPKQANILDALQEIQWFIYAISHQAQVVLVDIQFSTSSAKPIPKDWPFNDNGDVSHEWQSSRKAANLSNLWAKAQREVCHTTFSPFTLVQHEIEQQIFRYADAEITTLLYFPRSRFHRQEVQDEINSLSNAHTYLMQRNMAKAMPKWDRYVVLTRAYPHLGRTRTSVLAFSFRGILELVWSFEGVFPYVSPSLSYPFNFQGFIDDAWSPVSKLVSKEIERQYGYHANFTLDRRPEVHRILENFVYSSSLQLQFLQGMGGNHLSSLREKAWEENDLELFQDIRRLDDNVALIGLGDIFIYKRYLLKTHGPNTLDAQAEVKAFVYAISLQAEIVLVEIQSHKPGFYLDQMNWNALPWPFDDIGFVSQEWKTSSKARAMRSLWQKAHDDLIYTKFSPFVAVNYEIERTIAWWNAGHRLLPQHIQLPRGASRAAVLDEIENLKMEAPYLCFPNTSVRCVRLERLVSHSGIRQMATETFAINARGLPILIHKYRGIIPAFADHLSSPFGDRDEVKPEWRNATVNEAISYEVTQGYTHYHGSELSSIEPFNRILTEEFVRRPGIYEDYFIDDRVRRQINEAYEALTGEQKQFAAAEFLRIERTQYQMVFVRQGLNVKRYLRAIEPVFASASTPSHFQVLTTAIHSEGSTVIVAKEEVILLEKLHFKKAKWPFQSTGELAVDAEEIEQMQQLRTNFEVQGYEYLCGKLHHVPFIQQQLARFIREESVKEQLSMLEKRIHLQMDLRVIKMQDHHFYRLRQEAYTQLNSIELPVALNSIGELERGSVDLQLRTRDQMIERSLRLVKRVDIIAIQPITKRYTYSITMDGRIALASFSDSGSPRTTQVANSGYSPLGAVAEHYPPLQPRK